MIDKINKLVWPIVRKTKFPSKYYSIRNKWRLEEWKNETFMFIHIPKNAGTSICTALGIGDPGHFIYSQLLKYGLLHNKRVIFCILRDPLHRIVSIYNHAFSSTDDIGHNIISWITNYPTLDDFITYGLNKEIVKNHYFLYTQSRYISNNNEKNVTCLHINNIDNEISKIENSIGRKINLPIARKGIIRDNNISDNSKQIVRDLYLDDYLLISNEQSLND